MFDVDPESPTPAPRRIMALADQAANAQARARARDETWLCSRVAACVSKKECISRYLAEQKADGFCPSLECSIVVRLLKTQGGLMPKASSSKAHQKTAPKSQKESQSQSVSRAVLGEQPNPFAQWQQYAVRFGCPADPLPMVRLDRNLSFNSTACRQFNMANFTSVDVFFSPGRLGLRLYKDPDQGALRVYTSHKSRSGLQKVSAQGFKQIKTRSDQMDLQTLIHCLAKTSSPIGSGVVRQIRRELARLQKLDKVLGEIRQVTALHGCPATELPGHLEDIISNLAAQNQLLHTEREELESIIDDEFHHSGRRRGAACPAGLK